MKKLSVLGIIGGAALLAATPFSLQWPQQNVGSTASLLTLSQAEAQTSGMQRRGERPKAARSGVRVVANGLGDTDRVSPTNTGRFRERSPGLVFNPSSVAALKLATPFDQLAIIRR